MLAFPQIMSAQVKPHDYSSQNKTLPQKDIPTKSWQQGNKQTSIGEKTFKTHEYKTPQNASNLVEKNFYIDNLTSPFSPEKTHSNSDKKITQKDFSPKKQNWVNSEKQSSRFDTNLDITKKYKGKIDIEKRAIFDTDYLKHIYEDMQERSMQDINKYQFRRSHPTDPGIKTVRAGEQVIDDNSSFLDNFSTRKKIDVQSPLATFKGNLETHSANRAEPAQKVSEASNITTTPSNSLVKKSETTHKGKVQSIEYIDSEKSSKFDFLKVPKGMKAKGKAVIKVETE